MAVPSSSVLIIVEYLMVTIMDHQTTSALAELVMLSVTIGEIVKVGKSLFPYSVYFLYTPSVYFLYTLPKCSFL